MHTSSLEVARLMTARPDTRSRSALAKSLTLAAMSLGYGVVQLDVTIVNTALNASEWIGAAQAIALGAALAAAGCLALLSIAPGTSYWTIGAQLVAIGGGLGLLVPPLTATLLGSVEKSRSGIAAGVLNATRQTGSVLGVALFGSLLGRGDAFIAGAHAVLVISAAVLLVGAAAVLAPRSGR